MHRSLSTVALLAGVAAPLPAAAQWEAQSSGTTASLRGVSAVSPTVAWASGSGGTVLRTLDGGRRWRRVASPPGTDSLDFRDVHGVSASTAYLMSAGPGRQSRIYKTTSAGARWTLQYAGADSAFFLDAVAFWDARRGVAMSDPVDGRFVVLTTRDGGAHWTPVAADSMPPAVAGEAGFAAGGAALATGPGNRAWFGTGGKAARVFASADGGRSWAATAAPLAGGAASQGVFAIAFADARRGVAVGGDYEAPTGRRGVAAHTSDGGRSWHPVDSVAPAGYRSGLALVPGTGGTTFVAVGTSGSDRSVDGGLTWRATDSTGYNAVSFATRTAGWAVGPQGRIARYRDERPSRPAR
jgi:photosystem II stability/assembly factor-like uncharacterized protein